MICLSPTFDLARQTGVLETMSKFATEIRMVYALRGERGVAKLTYLCSHLTHVRLFVCV